MHKYKLSYSDKWVFVLCTILFVGLCVLMPSFLLVLRAVLRGGFDADVGLYINVGKGILLGLTPYIDLFESKPPGMFLVSSLSFLLFKNHMLLAYAAFVFLLAIPVLLAGYAWHIARDRVWPYRVLAVFLALVLGTLYAVFLENKAAGLETELFASVLLFLYGITLIRFQKTRLWLLVAQTLLLFSAIGLKETFLFPALAIVVLLCRNKKHCMQGFILPLTLAAVFGALSLLILGWFIPYITLHIPVLLQRPPVNPELPNLLSIFTIRTVIPSGFSVFEAASLLEYLTIFLWSGTPIFILGRTDFRSIVSTVTTCLVTAFALEKLAHTAMFVLLVSQGYTFDNPQKLFFSLVAWLIVAGLLYWYQYKQQLLLATTRVVIVAMLLSYAVYASGFSGNHIALVVPVLLVISMLCIRYVLNHNIFFFSALLIVFSAVVAMQYEITSDHITYWQTREAVVRQAENNRNAVQKVEAIMEDCNFRYIYGDAMNAFLFAKFPPVGPLIKPGNFDYLPVDHFLRKQTRRNLHKNDVLFITKAGEPLPTSMDVSAVSTTVPPCAQPHGELQSYTLLFPRSQ